MGMSHIPEDRHKHGLVLDYSIEQNMVLQRYWQPEFESFGFIKSKAVREYAERLIEQYDVRSGQGPVTITRSMSGGNQQKAIIAREIDKDPDLLVAVQPTRGLDVGAIEYIHSQLVAQRDKGKAVLLVSLELDEVMDVSDRILVMYEGELVGQLDPKTVSVEELGLYMAGAKRDPVPEGSIKERLRKDMKQTMNEKTKRSSVHCRFSCMYCDRSSCGIYHFILHQRGERSGWIYTNHQRRLLLKAEGNRK